MSASTTVDEKECIQARQQECYRHPVTFQTIDGIIHLPEVTKEYLNQIKDLPVQEGDVFVDTYPKSGTTWVSEIVWQIYFDGAVDMASLGQRVPYLEFEKLNHSTKNENLNLREFYLKAPFPRLFKTHLPYHLVPMGDGLTKPVKFIYVVRNPKDTAVSFYWHYKGFKIYRFDGSWDEFFEMFIKDDVHYGNWFDHVLGWWAHRDDPNILFLKYEDMKKNLPAAVQQIARFLGKGMSPDKIERIAEQTTFTAMSDGKGRFMDGDQELLEKGFRVPTGVKFIRKGEVGDWQNYFSEEQNKRFDALYKSKMAGIGLELEFT